MKHMFFTIHPYNSGPPYFTYKLSNITLRVGETLIYELPPYKDPDNNSILRPFVIGVIPKFIRSINLKMMIKPTQQAHVGEYLVYVVLKDQHPVRPLANVQNITIIVLPKIVVVPLDNEN